MVSGGVGLTNPPKCLTEVGSINGKVIVCNILETVRHFPRISEGLLDVVICGVERPSEMPDPARIDQLERKTYCEPIKKVRHIPRIHAWVLADVLGCV